MSVDDPIRNLWLTIIRIMSCSSSNFIGSLLCHLTGGDRLQELSPRPQHAEVLNLAGSLLVHFPLYAFISSPQPSSYKPSLTPIPSNHDIPYATAFSQTDQKMTTPILSRKFMSAHFWHEHFIEWLLFYSFIVVSFYCHGSHTNHAEYILHLAAISFSRTISWWYIWEELLATVITQPITAYFPRWVLLENGLPTKCFVISCLIVKYLLLFYLFSAPLTCSSFLTNILFCSLASFRYRFFLRD